MRSPNFHYSADPHDISAQIDLIGMPWLMIREDPSAAPIGGSARGYHAASLVIRPAVWARLRVAAQADALYIYALPTAPKTSSSAA
jgi:hypothetical protein